MSRGTLDKEVNTGIKTSAASYHAEPTGHRSADGAFHPLSAHKTLTAAVFGHTVYFLAERLLSFVVSKGRPASDFLSTSPPSVLIEQLQAIKLSPEKIR